MSKTTEALKLAEEALVYHTQQTRPIQKTDEAIAAIREALADHVAASGKVIAEQEKQEQVAWDLAEKVRRDLDRQSCPGVYMNIAVESIVKNYAAAIRGMK